MNVITPPPLPPVVDNYPTERIFNNGVVGAGIPASQPLGDNDGEDDYAFRVGELIDDAQSFEESTLAPDRDDNLQYFYGEIPAPEDEGTSTAVSTDFRDTVMAILPSLIRIFTSEQSVLICSPNYEGQEDSAKQCQDYLNYVFWKDNPGFLILHDIMKDALRCKIGVTKWWTDNAEEVTEQLYRNITEEQLQFLQYENPTLEVISAEPAEDMGGPEQALPTEPAANPTLPPMDAMGAMPPEGAPVPPPDQMGMGAPPPAPVMFSEVRVRFVKSRPTIKIESVPLDEFRISRDAKTVGGSTLVGHDRVVQVGELVRLGYDYDTLVEHIGASSTFSSDRQYRNPGIDESQINAHLNIRYGCYFIRIDGDGDNIPELREIHTIGDTHVIIYDEVVQHANYAVWTPDPEPHTVVGDTPAELVKDIQRIKTNMLRGALDSLAASIWPRTVFNETLVNADDVLNEEIGAAIRTKGDPANTVQTLQHLFVGQPVFQMFEVMETLRQQRTGINDASKGLDPKALQSTATSGVDTIISGAQERIELCARILAETGMADLFRGLLRECANSPNQERTIQLRGKWVTLDPSTYDPSMKIDVNPTLGKGSEMTRLMVLQDVKQTQVMAMEKFGPDNPLCGPIEFRNTLSDILAIANVKNVERYFKVITPEIVQAIAAAPKEPDPALVLAQAEMEKTRAKVVENIAAGEREEHKILLDDDFRRDELTVKSILDAAKVEGQFAYDVDEMALKRANVGIDTERAATEIASAEDASEQSEAQMALDADQSEQQMALDAEASLK